MIPRSPCSASTLLRTTAMEPVLVSVAAIFCPTLPDLPMPTMTILPRRFKVSTTVSTAASNDESSCARTALSAASSMSKTFRALAMCVTNGACPQSKRISTAKNFSADAAGGELLRDTREPLVVGADAGGKRARGGLQKRRGQRGRLAGEAVERRGGNFEQRAVHVGEDVRRAWAV